jgi:hypothetical protein
MKDTFLKKYLKYKNKYLDFKYNLQGGYPLSSHSDELEIDTQIKDNKLLSFYSRTNPPLTCTWNGTNNITFGTKSSEINKFKTKIINNMFNLSELNDQQKLDPSNWSDHNMIFMDIDQKHKIYSWNTLHNESLCLDSHSTPTNLQIINCEKTIIDVSNTKNDQIVNIINRIIQKDNTKVIMLQECEYDIYEKLVRTKANNIEMYYTPSNVKTHPGTTTVFETSKYGNCIILNKDSSLSLDSNHGVYKGNSTLSFQHYGIKFNFIVEGTTMYISTHLQNKEITWIGNDIKSVIEQYGKQIDRIILAGDFNAYYDRQISGLARNKLSDIKICEFSLKFYQNSDLIDNILIYEKKTKC